jgi:hypothetical protein
MTMPIRKYQIEGSQQEIESEMLDLPCTMPDDSYGYQILSVVEDMNHGCEMHVILAVVMDYPESWGCYLAQVARAIARDYAECFQTAEQEAFDAMCAGFNRNVTGISRPRLVRSEPD